MKTYDMPRMLYDKSEIFLIVHRDTLVLQRGTEQAGIVKSNVLTRAVCENYLGPKPVSPAMKKAVVSAFPTIPENIQKANSP